jgi:pimeloyl-ACP methyl ester carboxylesterase
VQLVFLHGMPFDGRMWAAQASAFPGATVVPSLYVFGESLVQWAEAVLNLTDASELVVVGSSCGGSCALEMARLRQDRIAALVLVGSTAAHRPEPDLRDRYVDLQRQGGAAALWNELGDRYFGPSSPASAVVQGRAWAMEQSPDDLIRGTVAFHSRPDASDVVAGWGKPLAVVVGEDDGFVSVNKARELAAWAPRGRCHVVPAAGHFPSLDAPDVFNALLQAAVDAVRSTA